jgi:predicted ATPase
MIAARDVQQADWSNVVHLNVFVILSLCSCCAWSLQCRTKLYRRCIHGNQSTKETWFEAEAHRVAGEIEAESADSKRAQAEGHFGLALAIARQQQAKSWELRAAMSLARHWRYKGKVQEARELLAPIYGWFTEGFDTRDLKDAKAMLEELAA